VSFATSLGLVVIKTPTPKSVLGQLNFSGGLSASHIEPVSMTGTLNMSGKTELGIPLTGQLNLSGRLGLEVPLHGTLSFEGTLAPRIYTDGTLSFAGALSNEVYKASSGTVTFLGQLDPSGYLDGTLSFSGSLLKHSGFSGAGQLNLSGALSTPEPKTLGGRLSFMRVLSITYTPYSYGDVSTMNMAAQYSFVIEQGSTFTRVFRWLKNDGVPFDLNDFQLYMTIRAYKPDGEVILNTTNNSEGITITKSYTSAGVFTVSIPAGQTSMLNFTRASFDIVAKWGRSYQARLVEGTVILSKSVTSGVVNYSTVAGTLSLSGVLTDPALNKNMFGTMTLTGGILRVVNKVRAYTGSLSLSGGLLTRTPKNVAGTLSLSGAMTPSLSELTIGTVSFSGDLTRIVGHPAEGTLRLIGD